MARNLPHAFRATVDAWTLALCAGPAPHAEGPHARPPPDEFLHGRFELAQDFDAFVRASPLATRGVSTAQVRRFQEALADAIDALRSATSQGHDVQLTHSADTLSLPLRRALEAAQLDPAQLPRARTRTTEARAAVTKRPDAAPRGAWWTLWPRHELLRDANGQVGRTCCAYACAQVLGYPTKETQECDLTTEPAVRTIPCFCTDAAFEKTVQRPFRATNPHPPGCRLEANAHLLRLRASDVPHLLADPQGRVRLVELPPPPYHATVDAGAGKAVHAEKSACMTEGRVLHPAALRAAEWWRGAVFPHEPPAPDAGPFLDFVERDCAENIDDHLRNRPDARFDLALVPFRPPVQGHLRLQPGGSTLTLERPGCRISQLWSAYPFEEDALLFAVHWWTRRIRCATSRDYFPDDALDHFRSLLSGALHALVREHGARASDFTSTMRVDTTSRASPHLVLTLDGDSSPPSQRVELHHACTVLFEHLPALEARAVEALFAEPVTLTVQEGFVRWEERALELWTRFPVVRDAKGRLGVVGCARARADVEGRPHHGTPACTTHTACICRGSEHEEPLVGPYRYASPVATARFWRQTQR